MRLAVLTFAAFVFTARGAAAQLVSSPDASPVGTWRGTSACVAGAAGCKDEGVVYHILLKGGRDSLSVDARRVVGGHEEAAGILPCQLNASRGYFTCAVAEGKWRFRARHDSLFGQLRLRDGTWIRDVRALRSRDR